MNREFLPEDGDRTCRMSYETGSFRNSDNPGRWVLLV
jgi:hypothetical protein